MRERSLMRTASVADLRNHFPVVAAWVKKGEEVQILKRGKPIARLMAPASQSSSVPKVDFEKQSREIWGKRRFSKADVEAMRAFEREGEEG